MSRRGVIATSASVVLAGCNSILGGGVSVLVDRATLNMYEDRSATFTIEVSKGAKQFENLDDPTKYIEVDAEITGVTREDSTVEIELDNFLRVQGGGDETKFYSHPPIGFNTDTNPDQRIPVTINYPEMTVGEGNSKVTYTPQYTFTGGSLNDDATWDELKDTGIDAHYNVAWEDDYEPFETQSDRNTPTFNSDSAPMEEYLTEYLPKAPSTWANGGSGRPGFKFERFSNNPPWTFLDANKIPETLQVPGTGHFAAPGLIKLAASAYSRTVLSNAPDAIVQKENYESSPAAVVESTGEFLNELSGTLQSIPGASTKVDALLLINDIRGLAESADGLTNTLEKAALSSFDWPSYLTPDAPPSTAELDAVGDIEAFHLLPEVMMSADEDRRQAALNQYNDALLQQYLLATAMEEFLGNILQRNYPGVNRIEGRNARDTAGFVLGAMMQHKDMLNMSFSHLTVISNAEVLPGNISFSDATIEDGPYYARVPTTVSTVIENTTDDTATKTIKAYTSGTPMASTEVLLDPGQSKTVELDVTFPEPNRYEVSIGNQSIGVVEADKAFEVGSPTLYKTEVEAYEPSVVQLPVTNLTEEDRRFSFQIDAGRADDPSVQDVEVPAGEEVAASATATFETPGTYSVTAAGESAGEVSVTEATFDTNQSYSMTGYNAKNHSVNPNATGPAEPVAGSAPPVRWRHSIEGVESLWEPIIVDSTLYAAAENKVVALDANSGEQQWVVELSGAVEGMPAYMDGAIYLADYEGTVYKIDAAEGEIMQTASINAHATSATVYDGTVYIYNEHQNFTSDAEQVAAYDADLNKKWATDVLSGYHTGHPAVADGKVVVGVGKDIAAYSTDNGEEAWSVSRTYSNSPVTIHDGRVYSVGWDGYWGVDTMAAHSLDDGTQVAGNNDTPGLYTVPRITDGLLYAGTDTGVAAYNLDDLSSSEKFSTPGSVGYGFAVTDTAVYAPDDKGYVTVFERDTGITRWQEEFDSEAFRAIAADDVLYVTTSEMEIIALG